MQNYSKPRILSLFESGLYIAIENDFSNFNIKHKSLKIAQSAAENGCDIIQYKARNLSYFKMLDEAKSISKICNNNNIPLIINNHIDLALDINAEGVHLSTEDVSVAQARAILGADRILGLTIRSEADARAANLDLLDYVTIAGIYATETDIANQQPIGIEGLIQILDIIRTKSPQIHIVAIGGITESNVLKVIETGVRTISVISAVSLALKPAATCKKLKKLIVKALKN